MLNENISLADFNGTFVYNGRSPKDFFRGKTAKARQLLPVDTILWKCSDYGISPSHAITEWWVIGDHLDVVKQRCARLRTSVQRYCRTRYAVIWEWKSGMSQIVTARLLQGVYAFAGETAAVGTQYSVEGADTKLKNIALIGGDPQLYIPNLTTQHISEISQKPSNL